MKSHNIIPFSRWLLKRWFGWIGRIYQLYDDFARTDSMAIFPTILVGMLLVLVSGFVCLCLNIRWPTSGWIALGAVCLWISNYFRIVISEKYKIFCKEQQQLFDEIKNS